MEQIVVDVVSPEGGELAGEDPVHVGTLTNRPVREFGCDPDFFPVTVKQCPSQDLFALPEMIGWRCIEIVDATVDCMTDLPDGAVLVNSPGFPGRRMQPKPRMESRSPVFGTVRYSMSPPA